MKQKMSIKEQRFIGVFILYVLPTTLVCAGIILIVLGNIKSSEFKKTEKIKMTFTEPVVSVSEYEDSDGDISYTMKVEYVYNGEKRIHSFTTSKKYNVGEEVTFTKYFTPDGTEIENKGRSLSGAGFGCLGLSLPFVIVMILEISDSIRMKAFFIKYQIKKKLTESEETNGTENK